MNGITLKLDGHSSLHLTNISAPPFGLTIDSKQMLKQLLLMQDKIFPPFLHIISIYEKIIISLQLYSTLTNRAIMGS
ncbi:hypothetical protein P4H73_26960 [Bacillus cereus]|nr:hypothetical protein [Bacillus cereus]MEB9476274.1 hypothetical protein [Bacillus cereus]